MLNTHILSSIVCLPIVFFTVLRVVERQHINSLLHAQKKTTWLIQISSVTLHNYGQKYLHLTVLSNELLDSDLLHIVHCFHFSLIINSNQLLYFHLFLFFRVFRLLYCYSCWVYDLFQIPLALTLCLPSSLSRPLSHLRIISDSLPQFQFSAVLILSESRSTWNCSSDVT